MSVVERWPDGARLAFAAKGWLFVMNLETGVVKQITSSGPVDARPNWSPDGKYMTFTYGKEGSNMPGWPAPGANICICDLATGKWTLVTIDGKHTKEPDWVVVSANEL